jgi:FixJ family two-component response regulator
LITDYKMKPLNGLELIAALRPSRPTLPVILLTGFADSLGLRPENTGANVVMQKSANELNTLLRNAKRLLQPPRKPARSNTSNKAVSQARSTSR